MPKVKCFVIFGLYCWFWSDDHDPPHFHIKRRGVWELRVKFLENTHSMFELKWGDPPNSRTLKMIAQKVTAHREQLLAEWEGRDDE